MAQVATTKRRRIRNRHYIQPCDRDPGAWAQRWETQACALDVAATAAADERQARQLRDQADEWRRLAADLLAQHSTR